jgi:hypothetical protein
MFGKTIEITLTSTNGNRQYPITHTLWKKDLQKKEARTNGLECEFLVELNTREQRERERDLHSSSKEFCIDCDDC